MTPIEDRDEQPEPKPAKIWSDQEVAAMILSWNLFAVFRQFLTV